jgi:hypothetical protein
VKFLAQGLAVTLISLLVAIGVHQGMTPAKRSITSPGLEKRENVYERVRRTGTIRCGYIAWPPLLDKDPNTGAISGFYADYMNALAGALDVKVTWEEVPIDMYCVALGAVPARIVNMYFTKPVTFYPFYAYVRPDDARFDGNLAAINSPDVTLSTMEGEYTSILARTSFPWRSRPCKAVRRFFLMSPTGKPMSSFRTRPLFAISIKKIRAAFAPW